MQQLLQLLRIKHWVKNGFLFIPAFFAARFSLATLGDLLPLFVSFCLAASSVYIFNDLVDRERDRLHPVKQNRPLASGFFSPRTGLLLLVICLTTWAGSLFFLQASAIWVVAYLLLNVAYTFLFKHIAIIDVAVISLGFVLRVLAGGAEISVLVSQWLIVIVFLLCSSLAFAKRRHDMTIASEEANAISSYTRSFLDIAITISMSITLMAYIIYSISPEAAQRLGTDQLYLTSFFVFLGILRYLMLTLDNNSSGTPVEIIWRDRILQLVILCWLLTFYGLIYGTNF